VPQRKPCDVNLFTSTFHAGDTDMPGFYPEGRNMTSPPGPAPTEARVRSQLKSFLKGSTGAAAALALFDRAAVRAKVPDATLRAALAAARVTLAQQVVDWFVSSPDVVVRYGGVPLGVIAVVHDAGTPKQIVFSRNHAAEHFALLSGVFTHEILHLLPGAPPPTEEVILHAVDATVHMQLVARYPLLATSGTELTRQMNDEVLIFVKSRVPGSPKSAIIAPKGLGTAPGSAKSKHDLYEHASDFHGYGWAAKPEDKSPAPPAFAPLLRKLLAPSVAIPKPLAYSKKTAALFSRMNDTSLSPVDRLRVSVLLGLVSIEEIVKYTGLPRAKAIASFRLGPILALK
jgi:hypothetical protein